MGFGRKLTLVWNANDLRYAFVIMAGTPSCRLSQNIAARMGIFSGL